MYLCTINFKKGSNITQLWFYKNKIKTPIYIKRNLNKIKSFDVQRIK